MWLFILNIKFFYLLFNLLKASYRAEREWHEDIAPSGRKKYGHWSEVMSLEELYGLSQNDYINKRAGLITSTEDRSKFESVRTEYFKKYFRNSSLNSSNKTTNNSNDVSDKE